MAKTYTSTVNVKCWKEHSCSCCGATYAYQLARKVQGTGRTPEASNASMQANIRKTLERDTDMEPCPTCGLYQPDMVGQRKAKLRWWMFWLALIALGVILIVRASDGMQWNIGSQALIIACGVVLCFQLLVDVQNPNKDLQSNQMRGHERVTAGKLQCTPGQPNARTDDYAAPSRSPIHLVALCLLLGSLVAAALPEIMRSTNKWPINEDSYPPVVGPGDTVRIYMDDSIQSIKGYWRGRPYAELQDPAKKDEKAIDLVAHTNQNDWGQTIYAKSDEKNSSSHPWVDVTLPSTPSLANTSMLCIIDLELQYPEEAGSSNFRTVSAKKSRSVPLQFASIGSGARYASIWWGASGAAIAMVLVSALMLVGVASAQRKSAKPTRVYT